ncbi:hypothetical protein [uncultured Desulfovibrio sp.]|uniref:hypothetical protein n=1 Tax=uncultured Desulfovibrio sp. TaxID=167968 RepID=UPI002624246A|nr:hypothetical protein [uncultured Desulfovibrio sp.]
MTQLSLFPQEFYNIALNIDYDGNGELQRHEIDATAYSISINGYTNFLKELLSAFSSQDIQIYITAHENASFKSCLKVVGKFLECYAVAASILSFHGCNPSEIGNSIIYFGNEIISKVAEYHGNTNAIILHFIEDRLLPEPIKESIIKVVSSNKARSGLDDFTSPLDRIDYDRITISAPNVAACNIVKAQRFAFKYTPPDLIEETDFEEIVTILYLSPELTEWKFQGEKAFWAEITDEDFLNRTKNKLFAELKGKKYVASGIKRTIKKSGAQKGKTTWTIEHAVEVQEPYQLE